LLKLLLTKHSSIKKNNNKTSVGRAIAFGCATRCHCLSVLPGAGAEGQHPTVGWSKARMGIRLLGRAMLGQTVVAAIIYGFVGMDKSYDLDHFAK